MITAIAIGLLAGAISGMLGVGGGVLFVPALVIVLGHGQLQAEATSLAAMVPVAALGAVRQNRYGNVHVSSALVLGVVAVPGALLGVWLANFLPVAVIRLLFSLLLIYTAWRIVRPQPVAE